ncbi:fumarylacetoacetate hydrolase family protein [Sphingobium sp. DC-2]|uniref:fumarylacetoacetate hydrolase family protein n=1 Tax=Sphingobium sp. DC-2 TaxID=1303256 RepID=UPI0004C3DD60|nr:fumarylacetoacetate hydrolase family protein [Sphingobium sp. DC-2]
MRLATFIGKGGRPRTGSIVDAGGSLLRVLDLALLAERSGAMNPMILTSMQSLIEAGPPILPGLAKLCAAADSEGPGSFALEEVTLVSPLPHPVQLRDFSVFEEHLRDAGTALAVLEARASGGEEPRIGSGAVAQVYRDYPLFYFSNRMNVAGTGVRIKWPADVQRLDFELEIAAVIGTTGRDIPLAQAHEHIFGYTIFNDVSARDVQWRQMKGALGPCKAKSYDNCNVLGPWIVTRDELPELNGLAVSVRVNGEPWIETSIHGMVHGFDEMVAFASSGETIFAGEVFGSGTVGGCCGLEMDRWLTPGDRVDLDVQKIGRLTCHY